MQRALVLLVLSMLGTAILSQSFGQDRLITTAGDTIYCKIESTDDQYIIFTQNGNVKETGKIAFYLVSDYKKNFDPNRMIVFESTKPVGSAHLPIKQIGKRKGIMVGLGIGFVYRLAKVDEGLPEELKKYLNKLKAGYGLRLEADYFFGRNFGLGAKYSLSYAQSKLENVIFELPNGSYNEGSLSDKIQIHSLGLHLTSRLGNKSDQFHFLPGLSIGYSFYQDNGVALYPIKITGGTFSIGAHLSMDFALTEHLYSCLGIDFTSGVLRYYDVEYDNHRQRVTLPAESHENLARFIFWGGLRYYFQQKAKPIKGFYD
ncbi:MAG: hypothetical protein K9G41_06245 [Flavobacteriales bacterium]|nr:hypothetical protein [Flavobacteriales bacterium]